MPDSPEVSSESKPASEAQRLLEKLDPQSADPLLGVLISEKEREELAKELAALTKEAEGRPKP